MRIYLSLFNMPITVVIPLGLILDYFLDKWFEWYGDYSFDSQPSVIGSLSYIYFPYLELKVL